MNEECNEEKKKNTVWTKQKENVKRVFHNVFPGELTE